jgi:4-carboxymuconolactone decarboxylase
MASSSNNSQAASDDKVSAAHKTLFDEGIKLRTQVNGAEYVQKALQNGSEFARPMQELVTEACWGSVWARPGLEKKWRSLINVAMLVALNRSTELATHVKGALTNGATEVSQCSVAFELVPWVFLCNTVRLKVLDKFRHSFTTDSGVSS